MAVWKSDRRGRDSDGPEPDPGESESPAEQWSRSASSTDPPGPRARMSGGLLCSESLTAGAGEVRSTGSGPPSGLAIFGALVCTWQVLRVPCQYIGTQTGLLGPGGDEDGVDLRCP